MSTLLENIIVYTFYRVTRGVLSWSTLKRTTGGSSQALLVGALDVLNLIFQESAPGETRNFKLIRFKISFMKAILLFAFKVNINIILSDKVFHNFRISKFRDWILENVKS